MAFGNGEVMDNFKTAVMTAVKGASIVHEGPVSFGGDGIGGAGGDDGFAIPVL